MDEPVEDGRGNFAEGAYGEADRGSHGSGVNSDRRTYLEGSRRSGGESRNIDDRIHSSGERAKVSRTGNVVVYALEIRRECHGGLIGNRTWFKAFPLAWREDHEADGKRLAGRHFRRAIHPLHRYLGELST